MSSSTDDPGAPPPDAPAEPTAGPSESAPLTAAPAEPTAGPTESAPLTAAPAQSAVTSSAAPIAEAPPITDASAIDSAYAPPAIPPPVPAPTWKERLRGWATIAYGRAREYFQQEPTFWVAAAPLLILSAILFTRLPNTNYIFDEQEALLANPYVNRTQGLTFIDAIHRDFWGLPPDRSVGSYRPIPNFMWRLLWYVSKQPFVHHFYNVLFHALVGALVTVFAYRVTRRKDAAYLSGFVFVGCAVLTEAVSGIVGIADVFGGVGALLALLSLALPAWAMPFGVFLSLLFALFSKESGLVCVPLTPFVMLLAAPLLHPKRPARVLRTVSALVASAAAFVLYVELRKRWFPSPLPAELQQELPPDASRAKHLLHDFLVWFHQAPLPKDPLNNPLAEAEPKLRIAGALRVYARGVGQILFPKTLSGDYSFPQEPAPTKTVFPESVLGALLTVVPLLLSVVFWIVAMVRERRDRKAFALSGAPDSERRFEGLRPPSRAWMLYTGAALVAVSLATIAIWRFAPGSKINQLSWNFPIPFWLSASGNGRVWHAVPWPSAFVPVGLVGIGLLVEGMPKLPRTEPRDEPIPLGRSGLLLAAIGLTWMVVSYFPHSNIPVILPTVRAERFWYFPALGTAPLIAVMFVAAHDAMKRRGRPQIVPALFVLFFGFQCVQAYRHAMDYRNDLVFWEATKEAVPNSAKAHLNYSVMKGARGDLETRLVESKEAMRLAPEWPMAHIYTGDTLCRLHRAEEAWPYYKEGFAIGPNEQSLISLALQCLYDEKQLYPHEKELRALAEAHPGSWIAYLAVDTLDNSEKHNGVDPKYRPRGYNEGPKE